MEVCLITPWDQEGGIATYSERFADALEAVGIDVSVVPIKHSESSNPLAFTDIVSDVSASADVIHVQFEAGLFGQLAMSGVGAPLFFCALSQLGTPVVTTLHEVHERHSHRGIVGDYLLRARDYIIERLAIRASAVIVVHSSEARQILSSRHGTDVPVERLLHPTKDDVNRVPKAEAKSQLGVDDRVLLTFGFLEEKKRYEDVIRVLPSFPDATYVIAGGPRPGEGEAVQQRVKALSESLGVADRVRFLGYVDDSDIPTVFGAADVVVLPYGRVSQSGVLNDALAHRKPVVASSLPAFKEVEAEYSCLLTYESESELEGALQSVLTDDTTVDRLQSRAEVYASDVSWPQFAAKSEDIYDAILSQTD
ncbi:glycosyltransferase [Halobellus inordinatus]|uniref:glycosyltransferase n=1 Tax=Halobellus inordinatus TaxID=1126236 RepID=UPI002115BD15|nr:glycosyltransferase [Halobellus ramosii]